MRLLQYICILILVCSVNSCSLVNTFYNNAPDAISWWLDDYFDFTSTQKSLLGPALQRVHAWHRQHELPEYIALLQELKLVVSKDTIGSDKACQKIERMKTGINTLQLAFIPVIIEIAPLLSDEQLAYFKQKLAQRADKWKSEWMQESAEAQIQARYEKMEDFAERVYGELNESQRVLMMQKLEENPTNADVAYAELLRRNDDALGVVIALRNVALSRDQKADLVKASFARLQNSPNAAYQQHIQQVTQRNCEMIADLHAASNATQKQHASAWFGKFAMQFTSLTLANQ